MSVEAAGRKQHLERNGRTACGRKASGLEVGYSLLSAIPFCMLRQDRMEYVLTFITCTACIRARYRL